MACPLPSHLHAHSPAAQVSRACPQKDKPKQRNKTSSPFNERGEKPLIFQETSVAGKNIIEESFLGMATPVPWILCLEGMLYEKVKEMCDFSLKKK